MLHDADSPAPMRAVTTVPDHPGTVQVATVPRPVAAAGQVRVEVRAAGLNRADLLQVAGRYPAPPGVPADRPGLEFAGLLLDDAPALGL
ncbi:MAG: hypothetical protein MUF40_00500, partial [Gemmatimonadaceae bacterium]|nr:hypothetical protein [Gemmatimonadaceae bacterium]